MVPSERQKPKTLDHYQIKGPKIHVPGRPRSTKLAIFLLQECHGHLHQVDRKRPVQKRLGYFHPHYTMGKKTHGRDGDNSYTSRQRDRLLPHAQKHPGDYPQRDATKLDVQRDLALGHQLGRNHEYIQSPLQKDCGSRTRPTSTSRVTKICIRRQIDHQHSFYKNQNAQTPR